MRATNITEILQLIQAPPGAEARFCCIPCQERTPFRRCRLTSWYLSLENHAFELYLERTSHRTRQGRSKEKSPEPFTLTHTHPSTPPISILRGSVLPPFPKRKLCCHSWPNGSCVECFWALKPSTLGNKGDTIGTTNRSTFWISHRYLCRRWSPWIGSLGNQNPLAVGPVSRLGSLKCLH